MKTEITLTDLAVLVHGLSGSTDITIRQSISIDTEGNHNLKFGIFHKRWIYEKTIAEVLRKWKNREGFE